MAAPRPHSAGLLSRTVHLRAAHPADIWLGERLRRRRKERGLSLTEVARRSGLSIGLISQVERGISAPSARALRAMSKALGLSSKALLAYAESPVATERGLVTRAGRHRRIDAPEKGIRKEALTPEPSQGVNVYRAEIAPGGSSGETLFTIDRGEQVGVVLRGRLELWIEEKVFVLKAGDSFRYHSKQGHRWRNPGTDEAEVIWVVAAGTGGTS